MLRIKETLKKVISLGLSMAILCSASLVGIHSQEYENGGLSAEELAILDELYEIDPDFTYEGELVSVSKETQIMETAEQRMASGNILERGAIGNNYMTIYITTSRISDSGKDTFDINATATWKLTPTIRMQDAFAIAWAKDFALKSSSCKASYKGVGVLSGKTNLISASPNAGVGYSVEASHYYGQALDWTRITARITQSNRSGAANVMASYCHQTLGIGGIGISFSKNPAITFSLIGTYDYMTNITSFNY